jgi:hypothetical protein
MRNLFVLMILLAAGPAVLIGAERRQWALTVARCNAWKVQRNPLCLLLWARHARNGGAE